MSDEEKIEQSKQDRKSESPEELNGELSNVNKEPQNANSKLQTENMEVHHHPHVEKKGFKEYFLEFLMIFLAVSIWLNKP